ncbi:MAG: OsmC family protein [Alistipes sp.]|nr:OsmC family protein [Alistipes sp.]
MHQSITIQAKESGKLALAKPYELDKLNPKELLLYSTALCAGFTLQRIVEKERVKLLKLEIKMSGELDTEKVEGVSKFESFNISYNIECKHIDEQSKVSHAVQLTTDKYCGGLAMCRKIAPVSHSISIVSVEVEA